MRSAECGMRNCNEGSFDARRLHLHSAFRIPHSAFFAGLNFLLAPSLSSPQALPPLPDTTGFGVHVLAIARAPDKAIWVGSYGQGVFVLRPGAASWEQLRHASDSAVHSISWDFVHAFGFGPAGEIWYGTVGNGWGLSTDGGKTWTKWEFKQLGPEWQYVAPNGIVTRGDTVYIGTADGIKLSWDRGATWAEITDSAGATTAQRVWGRIRNQYVLALAAARVVKGCRVDRPPIEALERVAPGRVYAATRQGVYEQDGGSLNLCDPVPAATAFLSLAPGWYAVGRQAGLASCRFDQGLTLVGISYQQRPDTDLEAMRHTWFERPILPADQPFIDQTYRYGSTDRKSTRLNSSH